MSAGEVRGPLPPGWAWSTLGEVADIQLGKMLDRGKASTDASFPYLRNANVQWSRIALDDLLSMPFSEAERTKFSLRSGDILVCEGGEPGRSCIWDGSRTDVYFQKALIRMRSTANVEPRWLVSWLRLESVNGSLELHFSGTTIKHLPAENLCAVPVPLPPLAEQRRIVAKLDAVMAQVREARAALEAVPALLEQYRRAVLAAAFRGELTADWRTAHPEVETASALLARMPVLPRPPRYDSRSLAVVPGDYALSVGRPDLPAPEGWSWAPLVSIARLESGHTPSRSRPEWWGGDVPWIGIRDARTHHGGTIDTTEQTTNAEGLANSAARLLPAGTVCLSRTASVGYVVVMGRPMATSQDFVNWVCTEALDPHWLKCLFLAEHDAIWRFGKGSTHTTVYFPEVLSFHVCVPPLAEQHEIVRRVEAALGRIARVKEAVEAQRQQLDALERAVLDKAFRGALVPQHPDDEPADAMLARLRAQRAAAGIAPKGRRGRPRGAGPEA